MHYSPEISLHIVAGALGLSLGVMPMFARKGGRIHKLIGRLFVICASVVMLSAIIAIICNDKSNFTSLSRITLTSSYVLWSAFRALKLKATGPQRLDVLASLCAFMLSLPLYFQSAAHSSVPVALSNFTLYWLWTVLAYDISRHWWKSSRSPKLAQIEHGIKMIAVYFAMLSAGAGNVLSSFRPWSIVLPNAIGMITMTGIALYYAHLHRQEARQQDP
ncbi:MAG: hypothetical protein E6Q34_07285 [Burkholderiaceae bacterium]|nr:MAG: hypothetical protein E6Q34_07285 [Burkholderiaceae bacterium]